MPQPDHHLPVIHFWGVRGLFSATALAALLEHGPVPQAVIISDALPGRSITRLPPTQLSLPVHNPSGSPDITQLAGEHDIPVYSAGNLAHPHTVETLSITRPDLAIVACFNRRIPPQILAIPRFGFWNIHPSLLPAYRGPAPLFWLFRHAATEAMGVTIHQMDAGLDTGDIITQRSLAFLDGISGREADQICAQTGVALIRDTLQKFTVDKLTTRKQADNGSSFSWPTPADFTLDTTWPARHAFNFMRATAHWHLPYPVTVDGKTFRLGQAVSFLPDTPAYPWKQEDKEIWIRFRPGALKATLA